VRIRKAGAGEPQQAWPQFDSVPVLPGVRPRGAGWRAWFAGRAGGEAGQ
jgi:hypothetical protein